MHGNLHPLNILVTSGRVTAVIDFGDLYQPGETSLSKSPPKTVMPIIMVESIDSIRNFYVETLGFDHLMGKGVTITDPLTMRWWGDRTFKVLDPGGYEIWFYQPSGEPKPPPGMKLV